MHLTPEQLRELDTLLEENLDLKTHENIIQSAVAHYVFSGLTFGLNENDERLLTPEREVEIQSQFQILLDENIGSETENIENNPVFIQLQSENIALQNENISSESENIENNPVFI